MDSAEALPADMMLEILSRASFETVERCKAVSKGLRRIIYDPTFLPLRCKRTNSIFGYFFDYLFHSKFVSDEFHGAAASVGRIALPRHMEILASCDHGILCCYQLIHGKLRYYVGKPATNQWQPLPHPKYPSYFTHSCALIVVESHPLRYKIVRLSSHRYKHKYIWELFDSQNWKWEKTQGTNLIANDSIISFDNNLRFIKVVVCVGKYVHYLTKNDSVLVFDVKDRSFRCFPLPEPVCGQNGYEEKKLVKYEGGLGFSCMSENWNRMDVWVAKGQRWTKIMSVDMNIFQQKNVFYPKLVEFITTHVAFMKTTSGCVFWNFRDGTFNNINVPYHPFNEAGYVFRFQSDFETVHLRGMREEEEEEDDVDGFWFPSLRNFFCF